MDPARYDGSRPEPPYNTDTDAVVALQEELDEMTADRDLFAKALSAMTADRDRFAAELARVREESKAWECDKAELTYRRAVSEGAPDHVLDPLWDEFDALRAALAQTEERKDAP